jgi:hypothetical protein
VMAGGGLCAERLRPFTSFAHDGTKPQRNKRARCCQSGAMITNTSSLGASATAAEIE